MNGPRMSVQLVWLGGHVRRRKVKCPTFPCEKRMFSNRWIFTWYNMCQKHSPISTNNKLKHVLYSLYSSHAGSYNGFHHCRCVADNSNCQSTVAGERQHARLSTRIHLEVWEMISSVGIGTAQQRCVMITQSLDNLFYSEIAENCSAP